MTPEQRCLVEAWIRELTQPADLCNENDLKLGAALQECLEEIDRLNKQKSLLADGCRMSDCEVRRLEEENSEHLEEIDRLTEENEDMRSKITGMFAGFCPPEEAMVLREATAKAQEENRQARELLKRCGYSGGLEKEIHAFLDGEES